MSSSTADSLKCVVSHVQVTDDQLIVALADGRTLTVPLAWYPRLFHGTPQERNHWRLIGNGSGIHWPDLDEDISAKSLLAGEPSMESQASLRRWLEQRQDARSEF